MASGAGGVGRVRTALWSFIGVYAVKGSTGSFGGVFVLIMFSSTGDGHLKHVRKKEKTKNPLIGGSRRKRRFLTL
jgi:hypothetical protein